MTETKEYKNHSVGKNKNIFYKIKLGFYWYGCAFDRWKNLMTFIESDNDKFLWERHLTFSYMNYSSQLMKVDSDLKYNDKFKEIVNECEELKNDFNEKIVKKILDTSKNKKFEWVDDLVN